MVLKTVHDKIDDIPEQYRDLYTEKAGKFELTGIVGVKTEADVQRVQKSLDSERTSHKETKEKLKLWGDLDPEETHAKLDKIPALEKAAAGKLDDATIAELANKQADQMLKSKLGPVERQLAQKTKEAADLLAANQTFSQKDERRDVSDAVRSAATELGLRPEAVEDAVEAGYRMLRRGDDGKVITKDDAGVTAGVGPKDMLSELRAKKPHWWPGSQGGGANGGGGGGNFAGVPATINGGKNPFSRDGWNLTAQGQLVTQLGEAKAAEIAKAAGSAIGSTAPPPMKR